MVQGFAVEYQGFLSDKMMANDKSQVLRAALNAETAKVQWSELQRHFARGVLIKVLPGVDLVGVAVAMAQDDKTAIEAWLAAGQIARATAEDAQTWHDAEATLWAVVAAPWVLVQPIY